MNCFRLCFLCSLVFGPACGDSGGPGGSGGTGAEGATGGAGATGGTDGTGANGGTGGAGTGGNLLEGGANTGGSGIGGNAQGSPECTEDTDCFLSSDCCECAGRPNGELAPACAIDCIIDSCTAIGVAQAQCKAGRCVTEASCDATNVTCKQGPPPCPIGAAPIIVDDCYQGGCMTTLECSAVSDCAACAGPLNVVCVKEVAQLQSTHCVDLGICPDADCDCLGPSVCVGSFDLCSNSAEGVDCSCPTCSF